MQPGRQGGHVPMEPGQEPKSEMQEMGQNLSFSVIKNHWLPLKGLDDSLVDTAPMTM